MGPIRTNSFVVDRQFCVLQNKKKFSPKFPADPKILSFKVGQIAADTWVLGPWVPYSTITIIRIGAFRQSPNKPEFFSEHQRARPETPKLYFNSIRRPPHVSRSWVSSFSFLTNFDGSTTFFHRFWLNSLNFFQILQISARFAGSLWKKFRKMYSHDPAIGESRSDLECGESWRKSFCHFFCIWPTSRPNFGKI